MTDALNDESHPHIMQSRMLARADPHVPAQRMDACLPRPSRSSWSRSAGNLLAEDLVHDLRASGKGGHDLVPVDQLGRGGLIVPGEQRDCFHRHAMRGQQGHKRVP